MGLDTSIKTCFRNYFVFNGRASRSEFWYFWLFVIIANIIVSIADSIIFDIRVTDGGLLFLIWFVVSATPLFAVGARRLHDTGSSAWWQWLIVVPGLFFFFDESENLVYVLALICYIPLIIMWCGKTSYTDATVIDSDVKPII